MLAKEDRIGVENMLQSISRAGYLALYSLLKSSVTQYFSLDSGYLEAYNQQVLSTFDLANAIYLPAPKSLVATGPVSTNTLSYVVTAVNESGETIGSKNLIKTGAGYPVNLS